MLDCVPFFFLAILPVSIPLSGDGSEQAPGFGVVDAASHTEGWRPITGNAPRPDRLQHHKWEHRKKGLKDGGTGRIKWSCEGVASCPQSFPPTTPPPQRRSVYGNLKG